MKPIILAVYSDTGQSSLMTRVEAIEYAKKAIGMYHSGTDGGGKLTKKPVRNMPSYKVVGYKEETFIEHPDMGRIMAIVEN